MGVYIKDIEMPFTCLSCEYLKCSGGTGDYCTLTKKKQFRFKNRPSWCPLVSVSPHGRLIDAGKMKEQLENSLAITLPQIPVEYRKVFGSVLDAYIRFIDDVPTVIPAEEGE